MADTEFWAGSTRLGNDAFLPTEETESSLKSGDVMPLSNLVRRSNSAERANSVECSNGATSGSPIPVVGHCSPTRRRLSAGQRSYSAGSFSSSCGSAGRLSPDARRPDALSLSASRNGSPTRIRRSVELARRISRGRSVQGGQQGNDSATRHEEDSVVSGHTIHSFQPASPLISPVSRQPTPLIMGDRLTMSPVGSSASCGKAAGHIDHAAVRLTAGGRRIGDREDGIEDEIMDARAGSFISRGPPVERRPPPDTPNASERQAVDAHTIMRLSGHFDPNHFEALNDSRTNLPRLPAPTPEAAPAGAPVSAPAGAPAAAPVAAPVAAPTAAPAGANHLSPLHAHAQRMETGEARVISRELERRPSTASINHDEFRTYQEEQQAVAVRKMHEVARGEVSFLDKLERVRRGETFRWRNPKHQENVLDTFGRGALGRGILKATVPAQPSDGGGEADSAPKRHEPDPRTESLRAAAPAKGSHEEAADRYESYQFDEPESKLHFEERVDNSGKTVKPLQLLVCTMAIILSIGSCIGLTSSFIAIVEGHIFSRRYSLVMSLLWPCCQPIAEHADDIWWLHGSASMDCSGCLATHAANASSTTGDVAAAAVAFVGFGCALMLLAALLCVWAPRAALSGLPQVKACRAVCGQSVLARSSPRGHPPLQQPRTLAQGRRPWAREEESPRCLAAEESLRRRSSACLDSPTPLRLPTQTSTGRACPCCSVPRPSWPRR